jgi:uncharacterized protein YgiM (DUF1202 family)
MSTAKLYFMSTAKKPGSMSEKEVMDLEKNTTCEDNNHSIPPEIFWNTYTEIDSVCESIKLNSNISIPEAQEGSTLKVVTENLNLHIRKSPGNDQDIVAKVPKGDTVTLVNKNNNQWWLVKTNNGAMGYACTRYLSND